MTCMGQASGDYRSAKAQKVCGNPYSTNLAREKQRKVPFPSPGFSAPKSPQDLSFCSSFVPSVTFILFHSILGSIKAGVCAWDDICVKEGWEDQKTNVLLFSSVSVAFLSFGGYYVRASFFCSVFLSPLFLEFFRCW